MGFLRLFNLLKNFDAELISALITLAVNAEKAFSDGRLTRKELGDLLTEVDKLADSSETELDDELIKFVQRLLRDPFLVSHVFDNVGFKGSRCDGCPDRGGDSCCSE